MILTGLLFLLGAGFGAWSMLRAISANRAARLPYWGHPAQRPRANMLIWFGALASGFWGSHRVALSPGQESAHYRHPVWAAFLLVVAFAPAMILQVVHNRRIKHIGPDRGYRER